MKPPLKILFISRASLHSVKGGDTVQLTKTAEALQQAGVIVDSRPCNDKHIDYANYQLIHFFNIRHPADMLFHIRQSKLPYVISTIYVDYAKPRERRTRGVKDRVLNMFSTHAQEYIKTVSKSIVNGEKIISGNYIWKGHKNSVQWILQHAAMLLPNSENEYKRLMSAYGIEKRYSVIPNGADLQLFNNNGLVKRQANMVLCVARIELIKNQLNLIMALNDSPLELYLIGDPAPNHIAYYNECKRMAKANIHFLNAMPQEELVNYYRKARVHVLPSWFETTGLASLEALYCGCNIVVTKYGDTADYFDPQHCFYCEPGDIDSIRNAVEMAAAHEPDINYANSISSKYNWQQAATKTLEAYQQVLA